MGHSRPLFLYCCLFCIFIVQLVDKILPMTGFKPRISGIGSDYSTNWATSTARVKKIIYFCPRSCSSDRPSGTWPASRSCTNTPRTQIVLRRTISKDLAFHFENIDVLPSRQSSFNAIMEYWANCENTINIPQDTTLLNTPVQSYLKYYFRYGWTLGRKH